MARKMHEGEEANPLSFFWPFSSSCLGKREVGRKKGAAAATASEKRRLRNRRARAGQAGPPWEALGLQGVNSVARELGRSVWLVMDVETR